MKSNSLVHLFVLVVIFSLPACHASSYPPYAIGFATPSGNELWVSAAHFDQRTWGTPVGSIACCWEESGKASIIFDRRLPKDIYVNWLEKATNTRYEAAVTLPADLDARAHSLPGYVYMPKNQREKPSINVIIGMAPGGHITVWLSNAPYLDENIRGRVLEIIARAEATTTREIPPNHLRNQTARTEGTR